MFFEFGRSARIKGLIEDIDLKPYLKKARELFNLETEDFADAKVQYRHFLYLVYWNRRLEGNALIVPTKLADKLWHAHILFTREYEQMCQRLFGFFLHHHPGLDEGTSEHTNAMKHTKMLHDHVYNVRGKPGFYPEYFSHVDVNPPVPVRRPTPSHPASKQAGSSRSSSSSRRREDHSADTDVSPSPVTSDGGHHSSGHSHSDHSFGGGSFGGGGASGGWDSGSSSSSDSGGGSSCGGGGGCGGGGD